MGFDPLLTEVKKFCSALKYPLSIFDILALHNPTWQLLCHPHPPQPTGCSCSPALLSSPFQVERLMQPLSPQTLAKLCLQARYQGPPSSLYAVQFFRTTAFWTVNFWIPSETLGNSQKPIYIVEVYRISWVLIFYFFFPLCITRLYLKYKNMAPYRTNALNTLMPLHMW